jgi:ABC-type sugar transport system ATPase subunit
MLHSGTQHVYIGASVPRHASEPIVDVRRVVKRFPGVVALAGVDFRIGAGEIVGLVGKNGAGKSSLIKVIAGAERPDEGELLIDGRAPPHGYAPHLAHRFGLAFVHQELGNFPAPLTVAENVALGTSYPRRVGVFVSQRELRRRVNAVFDQLQADIDAGALMTDLTTVEQRLVMIARALYHDARLLFLDEPSVSLTIDEVRHLHTVVRQLKEGGRSIVYVSHRLHEIVSLTDRVVVMQDGRVMLERPTADVDERALVDVIAGSGESAESVSRSSARPRSERPILRVRNLRRPPAVHDVSFDLYEGEILGLAGLVGAGRTEVVRMIFGADTPTSGTIVIEDGEVRFRSPAGAIRRGVALLPEDRRHEGLVLDFTGRENITLASLRHHRLSRLVPVPSRRSERAAATSIAKRLAIPERGVDEEVRRLSGGTQQKVVFAKWLERRGMVFMFDEPTQGVDVGAKAELFKLIQGLAYEGRRGVIVISSDFAELATICDRVVTLREGRVSGVMSAPNISEDALVRLAYEATPDADDSFGVAPLEAS